MHESPTFQKFIAAVEADDDAEAEQLATQLTPIDEAALLPLLQTADANQQWWAVRALALCGTAAALTGLLKALAAADPALRAAAALALGHLYTREPATVRPVLEAVAA